MSGTSAPGRRSLNGGFGCPVSAQDGTRITIGPITARSALDPYHFKELLNPCQALSRN